MSSPILIIFTKDSTHHYHQSKTGNVVDVNKMYADLMSATSMYGTITSTTTYSPSYWTSTDIPF